jgi:hypothetical protein
MTEKYEVTKDQYEYIIATQKKKEAAKKKKKEQIKKYHQSEAGKLSKKLAQRRWRAKKRASQNG